MFYPQEMTEIQLIVPSRDLMAVTKALADQGVFHQVDGSYLGSEKETNPANSWSEKSSAYAGFERRVLNLMQTLGIEENAQLPANWNELIDGDEVRSILEQIEAQVKQADEKAAGDQKHLEQLQNTLLQLEPISDLDVEVSEFCCPDFLFSMLGLIPSANIERLETSVSRVPHVLLPLRSENDRAVVWLAGPRRNADILDRAARSAYLNPLALPETYQGNPAEIIASLRAEIDQAQVHIAENASVMAGIKKERSAQLQTLLLRVRSSHLLADAIGRFGRLHYTYLIIGWVPTANLAAFSQRLKGNSKDLLIETFPTSRNSSRANVPVSLNNPRVLQPFQTLVTTYARPRYEEVDPTVLIALTFPLLFGAMFGDVGQGLVLALLGALVSSKRISALKSLAGLGRLVTICGVVAMLFGFLYGSVFGVETLLPALWMRPMENILQILLIAIGAGTILLSVGFIFNIYNAIRVRDWGRLLFDNHGLAGLVLYWSMVGLAGGAYLGKFPLPPVVLIIPAILASAVVMLSEVLKRLLEGHRPLLEGGPGTFAIQAFFELFETLISFLSNSLSYVRVGAFAVAHAGLSAVIFILGGMVSQSHGPGYWLVVVVGNLFIVGFEGLIVGIQTMRLEYYEFFSKFFSGGGMRYEPLTLTPQKED